jgi:hypothetical protein
VKEAIARLIDLQRADTAAFEAEKRRAELDRGMDSADRLLAEAKAAAEAAHKAAQEAKAAVHRREMDLKQREQRIQELNGKLGGATSNKEYQGLLLEIAAVRAENGRIEEQILLAMDESEAKDREEEAARARLRETERIHGTAAEEVARKRAAFEEDLAAARRSRDEIAASIPAEALRVYERIRAGNKRTGIAVAAVHGEYCQGCQMNVNSQELADLVNAKRLVVCRTCQRILVLE